MNNKIRISVSSFGHSAAFYNCMVSSLILSIDVGVLYPSGYSKTYSFDNYAKACAFIGRTLNKHPKCKCDMQIPCRTEMHIFEHYSNDKPIPAIKWIGLSMSRG